MSISIWIKVSPLISIVIKRVILSKENEKDLSELPDPIRKEMEFVFVEKIQDVLSAAIPHLTEHFAAMKAAI